MRIAAGEVGLAWALLALLTALSYPGHSRPGPIALAILLISFTPAIVVLSTARGQHRVTEGLERLLGNGKGRATLSGALLLGLLLAFTFNAFVAFTTAALCCSTLWSIEAVLPSKPWNERLTNWTIAGLIGFATLSAADAILNSAPIARQLGTPAEFARKDRYDLRTVHNSNFFRFRSVYEDTRRRPGVHRVIALGDSFSWGNKIASIDSTWPAMLEHILAQDNVPTEVVNMGVNGFATGNEAEMLRRLGWQFEPDLVIVQWLDNDALETVPNFGIKPGPVESVVLVPDAYRTGWIRKSSILSLLEEDLSQRFFGGLERRRRRFADDATGWLENQRAFSEMADSAAQHCTPVLLILYPFLFPGRWTQETYPEKDIYDTVAGAGRRAGLEVLNLLPAFVAAGQGRDWEGWWATPYDSHPGIEAQHVATRTIAAYIQEHRLLSDTTPTAGRCRRGTRLSIGEP